MTSALESVVLLQALDALDPTDRAAVGATADVYARGLAAYRSGDFELARDSFAGCPADPTASVMAERCRALTRVTPASWDGVTVLDHK